MRFSLFIFLCLLAGCYRRHLYVQQEWVDANFLASSKVHTPDPRQENPPRGQRLIIAWDFPRSLFKQGLILAATVRLWDNTQQVFRFPLVRQRDMTALFFSNPEATIDRKILTYKVQVFSVEGEEIEKWDHQLWTELIEVGQRDNFSSAHKISDSVSSQPMQGSVIDTP